MEQDKLERIGRDWLRVVALSKQEGLRDEHDHVRFRDSDLSVKGAAILGFAGLMLAADLVFLSAAADSFIAPGRSCGWIGFLALFVLVVGAFCAVMSIMISRKGHYESAWASFGLMKVYHDWRRRWLLAGGWLTGLGTILYLLALVGVVTVGRCFVG